MILSLLTQVHSRAGMVSKPETLWHPEYPIEQAARSRGSAGEAFVLREALRRQSGSDDTLYVADHGALRILGRSEQALQHAIADLADRYRDAFTVEPPSVRYVHGARVLEPWMDAVVNAPVRYSTLVERDFLCRRGSIRRLAQQGATWVLEGEAPLADLLGYAQWLRELTGDDPQVATWLSRYRPIDHGPRAA